MSASDVQRIMRMIAELAERVAALEAASSNPCAAEQPVVSEAAPLPDEPPAPPARPRSAYGRYLSQKEIEANANTRGS